MIRRLADRLLSWYCHPDFYPDISGDLEELYRRNQEQNPRFAGWRYLLQVIMLFRVSLLKPLGQNKLINNTGMFRNYFKISIRTLLKHKAYTFINVMGLAVGLAAFLLINHFIRFERSYDRFHKDTDQLYRLTTDQVVDGQLGTRDAMSFNPSGKVITDEIPEVTDYTTTYNVSSVTVRKGEDLVSEQQVIMVDEHFLPLFGYEVINGKTNALLSEPNTIVLTKDKAAFYFGDQNPTGKTLHLYSGFDKSFEVVGVIENVPRNTHYKFDFLISISTVKERMEREGWNAFNYYTYLKIRPGTDIKELEKRLIPIKNKYLSEESTLFFNIQPVTDIHLHSNFTFEPEEHGSAKSVSFLTIISIFIVLIAWVNYINLSTAKAVDRAKEVGLRKVIGARKGQIRTQFLTEAFLINLMGALLALGIAELAAPYFNGLIEMDVIGSLWNNPDFLIRLGFFLLLGTLVSGFYPALFLSNFRIVSVLKGKFRNSKGGVVLRKGLVVAQFAASLVLIAGTFIVARQVNYMRSQDLGMNTDQVVGFRNPRFSGDNWDEQRARMRTFREGLLKSGAISEVASTTALPGGTSDEIWSSAGGIKVVGKTDVLDATIYITNVDENYFDLLDMELLTGRNFSQQLASDSAATIVNEAFLDRMGLPAEEALLNEKIQFGRDPENDKYHIVGIVRNANRSSLKNAVEPTLYFYTEASQRSLVKLSAENYKEGLQHLEETWAGFFPTAQLEYAFLNDRFDRLYKEDKRFGAVFGAFSVLALIVAIMGLFGLSSFIASQRTKEVGVRKVLGASIPHIISLFYKEFMILIGISALIGGPVVYFSMADWLANYAYRIDFPWIFMVISVAIVLVCAFVTVGYQVYKVAILNPAQTLKYE